MSDSIEITKDKNIRLNFFVDALASGFGWYFHGFGLPKKLLENSKYLNNKKKFSLKSYLLRRKAKKFFEESDAYFKNDIEKIYDFLEEKKELIEKIYSYIPFFTKENWLFEKLTIIVLPANLALSNNNGKICLGIRPPELMAGLKMSLIIHEMLHLNLKNVSWEFIRSRDVFEIDAEELYVILKTKDVCKYIKLDDDRDFRELIQFDKYEISKSQETEMLNKFEKFNNPEEAMTYLSNFLKDTNKKRLPQIKEANKSL